MIFEHWEEKNIQKPLVNRFEYNMNIDTTHHNKSIYLIDIFMRNYNFIGNLRRIFWVNGKETSAYFEAKKFGSLV